jgi:dipeptidase D
MTIKDLQPKIVWNNFYGLTQVPRPSKHEGKVREYLLKWGKEHGIDTETDDTGNVIMRVPATDGYENRKAVVLQGHMDMVPQKTADTKHDFLEDPIETQIVGDWVGAKGTTLGADDGIGVAIALSVLEDKTLKHGPIEVLVTYDEETGMTGADCLKPGVLKGDILLNLDSETFGELYIGCAGGLDGSADFSYRPVAAPDGYEGYKLTVKGLQGGHSGMDIILYRANANKVAARILLPLLEKLGAKLVSFNGGSLRNAIPFEAEAEILVPCDAAGKAKAGVEAIFSEVKAEFAQTDPGASCFFVRMSDASDTYIQDDVAMNAVKAVLACPDGVDRMSATVPGLVETSNNMAIVKSGNGHIFVNSLMRSSVDTAKAYLSERMRCVFELAGAAFSVAGGYSGWAPKPDTPVIATMKTVFKDIFGDELKVMAIHAGLECALMGAKYPNWDMVSLGPTIVHPHSPDERVNIESVANAWKFVTKVLENIPVK